MAHHHEPQLQEADTRRLGAGARSFGFTAIVVGVIALAVAVVVAKMGSGGLERFGYAYVMNYGYFLSITLGGLFLVLITHLFRAGWVVMVRRIAEVMAANMSVMAVLFIPILLYVFMGNGMLYPWANTKFDDPSFGEHHAAAVEVSGTTVLTVTNEASGHDATPADHAEAISHDDHALNTADTEDGHGALAQADSHDDGTGHGALAEAGHGGEGVGLVESRKAHHDVLVDVLVPGKRPYLTRWFFTARWIVYLTIWCGLGFYFLKTSTVQETSDDRSKLTRKMEMLSAPGMLLFALTITFGSFDLMMSLDPVWFSTMFGVYYFTGAVLGAVAALILALMALQRAGYLPSVTAEHYHDLGKLLFMFVFFWGYIAFSQFMLIWYANLPETNYWFELRGITTQEGSAYISGWTLVSLVLLFGHLLIPFVLLLPRWVKRSRRLLPFWAAWMLAMHWVDHWWVVMPNYATPNPPLPTVELLCLIGVGGVVVGAAVLRATRQGLVAVGDPRLGDSLGHSNPF